MTVNGILNLYKPVGLTSHDAVARVRRILREKRVGHAGTLDPAAHGVLPICVGQATRVVEYLSDARKVYCAEFLLGVTTDTYDREGLVTSVREVPDFSLAELDRTADFLRGPIEQLPPIYSAIKIAGQPLYKAARAGTAGQIELKPRPVEIFRFELTAWERPWLRVWIECSKGTYIRSLAYDLGEKLGCGAFMHSLVRVQSGPFHLTGAVTLEEVAASLQDGQLETAILQPLDTVLADWPAWVVGSVTEERIKQGRNVMAEQAGPYQSLEREPAEKLNLAFRRVYNRQGVLLALLERDGSEWHPVKVFNF